VVRAADPYDRILSFLDWSRSFFFQVALQLYSLGSMDPVPDPLLLRISGSVGYRTWSSGFVARNSDHYVTEAASHYTASSVYLCKVSYI
jgi:hypothetical protein